MNVGSIVKFRDRNWVVLPSTRDHVYRLRPLTGIMDDVVEVHEFISHLIGYTIPEERLSPAQFPPPSAESISDSLSARLFWQAARLTLREGAAPLRCLANISIRPRTYQFVPLLMALRLDPVRLFIADDVGVGKTIEALLVARELFDRGEITRLAVLCPPYLCDQWQKELTEKFNLEAVVFRSGMIAQLEREAPRGTSIYEYFPIQVISIDWVKTDRNRRLFLQYCPELVIVDEVHGAAAAGATSKSQQRRHELLQEIARDTKRHLILLSATPHSGVQDAFHSLLKLLDPKFANCNLEDEEWRSQLARHFIQRTRGDINNEWKDSSPTFPERCPRDVSYKLSEEWKKLFDATWNFCSPIVASGENLEEHRRRMRYWGVLALLRCVMSSPAAAVEALARRTESPPPPAENQPAETNTDETESDSVRSDFSEEAADDEVPLPDIAQIADEQSARNQLASLKRLAENLRKDPKTHDPKLDTCTKQVWQLIEEGYHPIIWCRYVATAEYVGEYLKAEAERLGRKVEVCVITGRMGEDERRDLIAALPVDSPHILVATDCLSEGINLQEKFTAVIHYDLPWNPNRLEQREGRVDRFGQTSPSVVVVRLYGRDNPVDGAVLKILYQKADEIRKSLGTYVPLPESQADISGAIIQWLLAKGRSPVDSEDFFPDFPEEPPVKEIQGLWEILSKREKESRSRFAQKRIKAEEVQQELEISDAILGDPEEVRNFLLAAFQRLGISYREEKAKFPPNARVYRIVDVRNSEVKDVVFSDWNKQAPAGRSATDSWCFSFDSPTPPNAEFVGRNHRVVRGLARYLFEKALTADKKQMAEASTVTRCGVLRTREVTFLTVLLLLRVRYLMWFPSSSETSERRPLLGEEVLLTGFRFPDFSSPQELTKEEALRLLTEAESSSNVPLAEKKEIAGKLLPELKMPAEASSAPPSPASSSITQALRRLIDERAAELEKSHKRIREAISERVRGLSIKPQLPPDLLGMLVLLPEVDL